MAHAKSSDPSVFILPDLGEGVHEAELIAWKVKPGDRVAEHQILAEMETDKALVEVPSPRAGVIKTLHGEAGETLHVGNPLVTYEGGSSNAAAPAGKPAAKAGSAPAASKQPSHAPAASNGTAEREDAGTVVGAVGGELAGISSKGGKALATPAVRRLARDLGVDIDSVSGTGIGGRVLEKDVRAAASGGSRPASRGATPGASTTGSESPRAASLSARAAPASAAPAMPRAAAPQPMHTGPQPGMYPSAQPGMYPGAQPGMMPYMPMPYFPWPMPYMPMPFPGMYPGGMGGMMGAGGGVAHAPGFVPGAARPIPDPAQKPQIAPGASESRVPFRGVRRTIANRLRESVSTAVHFTVMDEADVTALDAQRRALAQQTGEKLSLLPFVAQAVCAALSSRFGALNATVDEGNEQIVQHAAVHLGIATDTDNGLMVPVIRNAHRLDAVEMAREIAHVASSARDRSAPREMLMGSTFTISNVGSHAGRFATPVINVPEVAILAVGKAYDGVVVRDGQPVVAKILPLSLACDHRVVDGATAALALAEIVRLLQGA